MSARELEAAERCGRYWVEQIPGDPVWNDLVGAALVDLGRKGEGMACLRRAIEAEPNYLQPRIRLANELIAARKLEEAEALLTRGLRLSGFYPRVPNALFQLAWLRFERGEADLAARTVRIVVERLSHMTPNRENLELRQRAEALLERAGTGGR
jgi:Tfp pilus assembly protein PilF